MPIFYFHLCGEQSIHDTNGTKLADLNAARKHATTVARELTFQSTGMLGQNWADWTLSVRDADGKEVFSLAMSKFGPENGGILRSDNEPTH